MAKPPLVAGALHDTTASLLPAVPLTAVGASGTVAGITSALARLASPVPTAFVAVTGDLVLTGSNSMDWAEWDRETKPWSGLQVFPIIGNHDVRGDESAALRNFFKRFPQLENSRYYAAQYGNVRVLAVDSDMMVGDSSPEMQWLESEFGNIPAATDFVLVLLHRLRIQRRRRRGPNGPLRRRGRLGRRKRGPDAQNDGDATRDREGRALPLVLFDGLFLPDDRRPHRVIDDVLLFLDLSAAIRTDVDVRRRLRLGLAVLAGDLGALLDNLALFHLDLH